MANNNLQAIFPKILAQGLMVWRQNSITSRVTNSLTSQIAGLKGSTIDVPVSSAITAVDVVPASTPPNAGALTPTTVPVTLDQWKEAAFDLSDNEKTRIMDGYMPLAVQEAVKALVNEFDRQLLGNYVDFYTATGTAGTTPFSTIAEARDARTQLNVLQAPPDNRHVLLDPLADGNAVTLQQFSNSEFTGSFDAMVNGQLNMRLGMRWWMNQNMPLHTSNAVGAGALTVNGVNAVNATSISIAKGAGANWSAVRGDIITISGRQYVVTANTTVTQGANTSVPISPPLPVATVGGEAVTVTGTHRVNLAIHRDAIAWAARPLDSDPETSMSQIDPISGIPLRVEYRREHKRSRWSFDLLWGSRTVRPGGGVRILG